MAASRPARPISPAHFHLGFASHAPRRVVLYQPDQLLKQRVACLSIRGRWDASSSALKTGWDSWALSPDGPDGWIATKTRGQPTDPLNTCPVHLFAPTVATWQNALPGHAAGMLLPSLSKGAPPRTRRQGAVVVWRSSPGSAASRVNRPIAPLAEPEPVPPATR